MKQGDFCKNCETGVLYLNSDEELVCSNPECINSD